MKKVEIYEEGERVTIEMEVSKVVLEKGSPKYELRDPRTGKFYDYKLTHDQVKPVIDKSV